MDLDVKFMRMAYQHGKFYSNDPRTNVGAIISLDGVLGKGANSLPVGVLVPGELTSENKGFYLNHAERKAIAYCSRWGIATDSATMHTPWEPCSPCALSIIDAGIKRLVLHKDLNDYYRKNMKDDKWLKDQDIALENLRNAGVVVDYLEQKLFSEEEDFWIMFRGEKFRP